MEKISYEVIGKDYFTNKEVEHSVVASNPAEAKLIATQKYPRLIVDVVYPSKFKYTNQFDWFAMES